MDILLRLHHNLTLFYNLLNDHAFLKSINKYMIGFYFLFLFIWLVGWFCLFYFVLFCLSLLLLLVLVLVL